MAGPAGSEFEVELERGPGGLGLKLGLESDIEVRQVLGGAVGTWNSQHPVLAIRPGDVITSINGLNCCPDSEVREQAIQELVGATELLLTLRPGAEAPLEAPRPSLADRPARRMLGTRRYSDYDDSFGPRDGEDGGPPPLLPAASSAASTPAAPMPPPASAPEAGGYPPERTAPKTGKKSSQPQQTQAAVSASSSAAQPATAQSVAPTPASAHVSGRVEPDAREVARGLLEARKELRTPLEAERIGKNSGPEQDVALSSNMQELEESVLATDFGSERALGLAEVAERLGELQGEELFSNLPLVGDDKKR